MVLYIFAKGDTPGIVQMHVHICGIKQFWRRNSSGFGYTLLFYSIQIHFLLKLIVQYVTLVLLRTRH